MHNKLTSCLTLIISLESFIDYFAYIYLLHQVKGHIQIPYKTTSKMIILYLYLPSTQCFGDLYKVSF